MINAEMTRIKLGENSGNFAVFPFYKNNKPLELSPLWGMTLKNAGSMRFRWNEINPNRDEILSKISETGGKNRIVVPVELDHTKIVYDVKDPSDTKGKTGDGIITDNLIIMPVVTVADCMPVFLYDTKSGAFGVVHSGWKGTGIAGEGISLLEKKYGAKPENICAAIGAHIHSCCYVVTEERADYFSKNFTSECVTRVKDGEALFKNPEIKWNNGTGSLFRLSLEKANLSVLKKNGIPDENIVILDECTCCNEKFGSNRRETAMGNQFTVQAAFVLS